MKSEDQILERLLRQHHATPRGGNGGDAFAAPPPAAPLTEHLDADELSAFAEDALPPNARARYAAHLADCDRCRALAVLLTNAAGIVHLLTESESAAPAAAKKATPAGVVTKSLWGRLGAFFGGAGGTRASGWRYAMPLLAFLALAGVVWRAYDWPRSLPNAARSQEEGAAVGSSAAPPPAAGAASTTSDGEFQRPGEGAAQRGNKNAATSDDAAAERDKRKAQTVGDAAAPAESASSPSPVEPNQHAARAADGAQPSEVSEGAADNRAAREAPAASARILDRSEPAAPPPPPPATTTAEPARRARQNESAEEREDAQEKPRYAQGARDSVKLQARTAPSKRSDSSGAGSADDTDAAASSVKREAKEAGERRAIAGRSFLKRDETWVDAAYRDGQATTNVSRNSEQYRALVADEPGLRAVAEQLGGEVIVIWKGRAYRFR